MTVLICLRLGDMSVWNPAQEVRRCDRCGEQVGVYARGLRELEARPETQLVCLACARRDMPLGESWRLE